MQRSGIGDNLRSIPTHKHTLQSLNNPAVFIMGDATNLPGSKAGLVAHMKVITCLRDQQAKGASLTIRSMGKSGIFTTKELYDLFPGGPLKKSSKIAGIPKPVGCI